MTSYVWGSGDIGSWDMAADWSDDISPSGTLASVTIAGTGSEVTVPSGESYTINSLTLGAGSPSLEVDGFLGFAGTSKLISLQSGTLSVDGGTLAGATITQTGGMLALQDATLDGISYSGTLDMFGYGNNLYVENGLTASGGVIDLSDPSQGGEYLYFEDSETLDNQTIVTGEADNYGAGYIADNGNYYDSSLGQDEYDTLTLRPQSTILQAASITNGSGINGNVVNEGLISIASAQFYISDYYSGAEFVNANTGTIAIGSDSAASTPELYINIDTFDNQGLIEALGAGTAEIDIQSSTFTNFDNGTLSGGTYEAGAGATLAMYIENGTLVTTADTDFILNGADSEIEFYNGSTSSYVTIEEALTTIGASGTLDLLDARGYTTSNKINLAGGTLALDGGTFAAGGVTLSTASAQLIGSGVVQDAVTNKGTIEADPGTLDITGSISGTGVLVIDQFSELELGAGTAENVTFTGAVSTASTLKLDAPLNYTGTLTGLAVGDVIDIPLGPVNSVSTSGDILAVSLSSGSVVDLTLASAIPSGERFGISPDGGTGSDLTLFREAAASAAAPNPLNFGEVHAGSSDTSAITIANTQPDDGFSEGLDASFSSTSLTDGSFSASGSFTTLAAGSTNSTSLNVTLGTGTGGTVSGSAVITLASDGQGTDNDSALGIGTETVTVTGAVFNYATASAVTPNPVNLGETHTGTALSHALTLSNTAAPGAFSEGLDASFSGTSSDLTASGSVSTLAAGGSTNALAVTLHAGTAGSFSGTATIGLTSDGAGIDTLASTALGTQTVTVTGEVFNYATASAAAPDPIDLGIVHVGGTVAQFLTLSNIAASGLYSENLDASFASATSGLTTGGTISELGAGTLNSTGLAISLSTGTAGIVNGTATIALTSDGTGIDTLGTTSLASQTVNVNATIVNYATAALENLGTIATLTGSGSEYVLDFGTVAQGSSVAADSLGILNSASGLADSLSGSFAIGPETGFINTGFTSFSGIGAGAADTAPSIELNTSELGSFSETIVLDASGSNASGYSGALALETLVVTGDVHICYLRGTRIVTPMGERFVEDLRPGDEAVTRRSGIAKLQWIGRQNFAGQFLKHKPEKLPVCVHPGALGNNIPRRPLFVSPGHSLLLGDTLVLARNLVNGITITQNEAPEIVEYYALELDAHDCVMAEGMWAESFADGPGLRAAFHNAADYFARHPDYVEPQDVKLCAPRPQRGQELAEALAPVVARAAALATPPKLRGWLEVITADGTVSGWAQDEANPELPVWVEICAGEIVLGRALACDYRGDLAEAGIGKGRALFSYQLPSGVDATAITVRYASNGEELPHAEGCIRRAA